MWIRSQDKKELVNVIQVSVSTVFGDKKNKAVIFGRFAPNGIFSSNKVVLGTFPTIDDAIEELNEIQKNIIDNPNGIYNMKNNKND